MTVAIIAVVLAAPIVLAPVALIAYINISGMVQAARETRRVRATGKATV
jgi:hypothetical protein